MVIYKHTLCFLPSVPIFSLKAKPQVRPHGKVYLPYEPGDDIPGAVNATEENFCVNMIEFPIRLLVTISTG
jgi:hypothetical protein